MRYREVVDTGRKGAAPLKAVAMAAVMPALVTGFSTPGLRQVVDRVLPSPGEGPSEKSRAAGEFVMEVHATTTTGARYVTTVSAQDPATGAVRSTVKKSFDALEHPGVLPLVQGPRCLLDRPRLPEIAGVLTPATGLGEIYAARLVDQGFTIETRRA